MANEPFGPGSDSELESLFSAARAAPALPQALRVRILADAAEQAGSAAPAIAAVSPPRRRARAFLAALGGWEALSGLAAATAVGFVLGFSSPSLVEASGLYGSEYSLDDLMALADLSDTAEPLVGDLGQGAVNE